MVKHPRGCCVQASMFDLQWSMEKPSLSLPFGFDVNTKTNCLFIYNFLIFIYHFPFSIFHFHFPLIFFILIFQLSFFIFHFSLFTFRPNHGRDFAASQDLSRFVFYQYPKLIIYVILNVNNLVCIRNKILNEEM